MLLLLFFNHQLILFSSWIAAQIFYPTAELAMPIEILTEETKTEIETHPVTAETKIRKCSV